jgi:N-carbamoylputrescine amidase
MYRYSSDEFRVGLVQMACSTDRTENLEKAICLARDAVREGAQIVCFQELFLSQYFCREERAELFDLADSIPGESTEALGRIARELGIVIVASLFEKRAAGLYHNTAAILNPAGELQGIYRKMHIPDDPLYFEKFYFTPGDTGFRVFETPFARVGVLICWDQWYPEAARLTAMAGAEILLYPTAIGWHPSEKAEFGAGQLDAWQTIQRAHAIANGIWVAAVNRVGHEGAAESGLEFWGHSFVADPFGVKVAEANSCDEQVLVVSCSRSRMEEVRRGWPFFRDRRIDAYGGIAARWISE